jgi:hypothetical protein
MNRDKTGQDQGRMHPGQGRKYELLERVTACVLALVAASLAWLLLAGSQIAWPVLEWEVVSILGLFTTALVLVSVLALLKSRA